LGFGPFADGRLVPEVPSHVFAQGRQTDVPLIIGTNNFEASLMDSFHIPPESILSKMTPALRAIYKDDATSDQALAQSVFTDSVMGAPARWVAAKAASGAPSYLYHFSYVAMIRRMRMSGASHGSEVPYVFGTGTALAAQFGITLAPQDLAMEA